MNGFVPGSRKTLESIWRLQKIILDTLDFRQVVQKIVDSVAIELNFLNLGYKIVVLALSDDEQKVLRRVSMSQTDAAEVTMNAGLMSFDQIVIPYSADDNICIKTLKTGKSHATSDWKDILTPPMAVEESRRLQMISGIKQSMVYPVREGTKIVGVMIFSLVKDISEVDDNEKDLIQSFTDIVGLAIHDSELYTTLEETSTELKQANKKLQELDKLKDEFISIASHELRSPAAVVKNYIWSVINEDKDLAPQAIEDLQKAAAANERLVQLVNDLLDVSRIEGGRLEINPEVFDLAGLVSEVVAEAEAKAKIKMINLGWVQGGEVKVKADLERIRQVVINLIDNAIKYSQENKEVKVEVSLQNGMGKFAVIDNGIGIDPEQNEKMFTKFGRLDTTGTELGKVGGTGLGLFVCKKIIELSGGKIDYESQLGKGTTFRFEIPAAT